MNAIELSRVASVYVGKANACCCGCSGKHSYASEHREWAAKNRGYSVSDEDVSDRAVKLAVSRLNKNPATKFEYGHAWVKEGSRLVVAYFCTRDEQS